MSTERSTPGSRILTPDQRPRVFISSTLQELAHERAAARAAVERLRLIPVLFELGARPHAARALYRAYLEQSHVFVGMYFERYGWVAPGEEISGLEDEYRLSGGLPRLIYLKSPAPHREPRLAGLLDTIRLDDTVSYKTFESADELEHLLAEDLAVLLAERFLLGGPTPAHEPDDLGRRVARRPIPTPVNRLVGRTDELAEIERFIDTGNRLVTVVGPGGIGKSRVALEAARWAASRHPDRVAFVPLESVHAAAEVLPAVAAAIGLGLDGGVPVLDALAGAFGDRSFVLILDNFEQVLPAATHVAELLSRCPDVTVVVTSRAPLRIRGETLLPLGPLSLPSDERALSESAAVRLFVERAQSVCPGFSLDDPADAAAVAELCRRLDGIPLALELAAGRSRLLPPRALLERLGSALDLGAGAADLPARQRTLRDTLAWSEQLLEPQQRSLLAFLSVFGAPWTLTDAEDVAPPDASDTIDDVAALVEHSLVAPVPTSSGDPRFQMFNTVRAYAGERLEELGARELANESFCARMISQVPAFAGGVRSRDQARWRAEFRLVWPDLRLAWELSVEHEQGDRAAVAAQLIVPLWLEGRSHEVVDLVAASVRLGERTQPSRYGDLVVLAAHSAFYLGDYDRVLELLSRIGTTVPRPEVTDGLGAIPLLQGYLAASDGDLDAAERLLSESVERLRKGSDNSARWIEAFAHNGLGSLRLVRGDAPDAVLEFETSRRMAEDSGNIGARMQALVFMGGLALVDGRVDEARKLLLDAAELVEQQPFYEGNAYCLEVAASYALVSGRADGAARALGQASALRELIGARVWALMEQMSELVHTGVREALGDEAFESAFAGGRAADPRTAAATVRAVVGA